MRGGFDAMFGSIGRTLLVAAAAAASLISAAPSSPAELDFSGYTVHYPSYQCLYPTAAGLFRVDRHATAVLSRVRLKPQLLFSRYGRVTIEYEISGLYHSSKPLFPLPIDETNRQLFDLTWNPVSEEHYILIHTVDRCYYRYEPSFGEIVVGRQRISWGTGRIWNPTDLFNPINPASFEKIEKDGADAISLKIYLGPFSDVQTVVQPQEKWEDVNGAVRLRTHAGEYDFSLVGGYFDRRITAGGDFAGNLLRAGVRGEGIVSFDPDGEDPGFSKWIVGIDNQFTSELYALLEYHFNGEGGKEPREYDLVRLARGEILNLGRQFLFAQASYLLHPLWNLSVSLNESIGDGSGFAGFLLTYSVSGSADVALGAQHTFGDRFDEYWYYPTSLYLRGIYYF